jgi:6-phosphofructokinase 1
MVKGLSHIVYVANSGEIFTRTVNFYKAFGFKVLNAPSQADREDDEGKETWLKLAANEHAMTSDIVIRLILRITAEPRPRPDSDQDWSLNESALALSIFDVGVLYSNHGMKQPDSILIFYLLVGSKSPIGYFGMSLSR